LCTYVFCAPLAVGHRHIPQLSPLHHIACLPLCRVNLAHVVPHTGRKSDRSDQNIMLDHATPSILQFSYISIEILLQQFIRLKVTMPNTKVRSMYGHGCSMNSSNDGKVTKTCLARGLQKKFVRGSF